jgi:hypothetical protein
MNALSLSPQAILAVPISEPERLFSSEPDTMRARWHALATRFHPDRHPDLAQATEVLQHINALHAEALRKLASGLLEEPGRLKLEASNGRRVELAFRRKGAFELGEHYIGEDTIAFSLATIERDLFDGAVSTIRRLRFRDDAMRKEMRRFLPEIVDTIETAERLVLVVRRAPGEVLLADLVEHIGGRLPPQHAAWIISGLENLACYLDWAGLMHGGIGSSSVFVSPAEHTVALRGGWWYAASFGARLHALPERTLAVLPPIVADSKRAASAIDLELVRLTGREMLGDASGTRLLREPSIPKALSGWLQRPPSAQAIDDYRYWETARDAAFGPRRFVALAVDAEAIYPPA